jgi:hypothetical protein
MFLAIEENVLPIAVATNSDCFFKGFDNFGITDISFNRLSRKAELLSMDPELSARKYSNVALYTAPSNPRFV